MWRTRGLAFPPEDQARVFDAFVQAGGARSSTGVGLGLGITRNFVQLLGGTIELESTAGQGSRFHVEIPAEIAPPTAGNPAPRERIIGLQPRQPAYRILIVEDQHENRLLLQRLLRDVGFDVRVALDGVRAVETFREWQPHFIWMDLELPQISGIEATRRIREMDGGSQVKIVAMTASAFKSRKNEVLTAGFDGFLAKPYRHGEIFDCMERLLGVKYSREATPEPVLPGEPGGIDSAALAALPSSLRKDLEEALVSLDPKRIEAAVDRIADHDSSLGRMLARLAGSFAYTPIFLALEKGKPPVEETKPPAR